MTEHKQGCGSVLRVWILLGNPGLKPRARTQEPRLRGLGSARGGGLLDTEPRVSTLGPQVRSPDPHFGTAPHKQHTALFWRRSGLLCAAWAAAALGFAAVTPSAWAGDWDNQSKDCLKAFGEPEKTEEKKLMGCADVFGMDAHLDKLSGGEKSTIEKGCRWLYDNGSDVGAKIAREALARLEIKLPARAAKGSAKSDGKAATEVERIKYDPPEAKDADRKLADKTAKDGVVLLKKKKWKEGVALLDKALAKDGRSEYTLFNMACGEANMDGKAKAATGHLQMLADLGTDNAVEKLMKARTDADLEPLHDDADFKRITGYLRIQVVNTIGDPGDKAVDNIKKLLEKLQHKKPDLAEIDKPQEFPTVLFKPHAKAQTALIADLLNHPKTRIDPLEGESKYDLIIRWGAKTEMIDGKAVLDSVGPDTADESIEAARKKQNKILAQPDAAIAKVNKVVGTPERAYGQAEAMGKRVTGTVDKAKGTVDKVKGLGDKLNKL